MHRHQKRAIRVLLFIAIAAAVALRPPPEAARSDPEGGGGSAWRTLAPSLAVRRLHVMAPISRLPVDIHVVRLDPRVYTLRVLDSRDGSEPAASVPALCERSGALAAINGSFFLDDYTPLGLLVSEGRQRNPLRKADWGVFALRGEGKPSMVHTRDWRGGKDVEFAIQTGPRLVVRGEPLSLRLNLARRSALCIDAEGQVALLATSGPLPLSDLAEILRRPPDEDGLGCALALNLDGGSSTQLHVAMEGSGLGVSSSDRVPIAVGVFRRDEHE